MSLIIVMLNLIQLCLVCKKLSPKAEEKNGKDYHLLVSAF